MKTLRPHQREAVDKLDSGKILCGGVGTGKTLTAATYYVEKESPKDVYVITTAKKRDSQDWQEEFLHLGVFGEGKVDHGQLTVDSWNNIVKYEHVSDAFFIFDEQRLVGNGQWVKSFLRIARRNRWVLLSATPGDTWMDYVPVFLANSYYANRTQFKREHVVYKPYSKFPKIDRYVGTGKLARLRNQLLVEMPYEKHTVRHGHIVSVDYDKELFKRVVKDRWHVYETRPLKDVAELFSVMRKVVNSDASRMDALKGLLQKHPRIIVFYNFDYELEMLRTLISNSSESPQARLSPESQTENSGPIFVGADMRSRSGTQSNTVPIAEWNGHKHEPIPKTDRWVYLVQYVAGAEGWNCVETDAMVMFSLTYSYKNWHQAHGRIDRLNTPYTDLNYYYFMSDSMIDKAVWKSLNEKKSFNESSFARNSGINT